MYGGYLVRIRPNLAKFLANCNTMFDVILFTAADGSVKCLIYFFSYFFLFFFSFVLFAFVLVLAKVTRPAKCHAFLANG